MNQNNNKNKFNRSTEALSNWPFKQIRIDCSNHPVLTQTDKCAYRLSAMWSQQEELMVKGLSNSLQVDPRQAIRIALYETSRSAQDAFNSNYIYASKGSTERGHTSRYKAGSISVTKQDKQDAQEAASALGITDKEFIRLSIIYVAKGIRDNSVRITKSKKRSQLELRKEWSKENVGKESTIKPLLEAQKEALQRKEDEELANYQERKERKKWERTVGKEEIGLSYEAFNLLNQPDPFEEFIREIADKENLSAHEEEILRYESYGITREEAEQFIKEEEEDQMTDDELDELLKLLPKQPKSASAPLKLPLRKVKDRERKQYYFKQLADASIPNDELPQEIQQVMEDYLIQQKISTFFDELYKQEEKKPEKSFFEGKLDSL